MYELSTVHNPPLRAVLGSDAWQRVHKKLDDYRKNYEPYEKITKSTDVDK